MVDIDHCVTRILCIYVGALNAAALMQFGPHFGHFADFQDLGPAAHILSNLRRCRMII